MCSSVGETVELVGIRQSTAGWGAKSEYRIQITPPDPGKHFAALFYEEPRTESLSAQLGKTLARRVELKFLPLETSLFPDDETAPKLGAHDRLGIPPVVEISGRTYHHNVNTDLDAATVP